MINQEVRAAVRCPQCGADRGERCREAGREVDMIHAKRRGLAEMKGNWQNDGPTPAEVGARKGWRRAQYGYR